MALRAGSAEIEGVSALRGQNLQQALPLLLELLLELPLSCCKRRSMDDADRGDIQFGDWKERMRQRTLRFGVKTDLSAEERLRRRQERFQSTEAALSTSTLLSTPTGSSSALAPVRLKSREEKFKNAKLKGFGGPADTSEEKKQARLKRFGLTGPQIASPVQVCSAWISCNLIAIYRFYVQL